MSTLFIALQCCQCSTMQVKQKKKSSNKWNCAICNQKQSVRRVFAQGFMAKDVRKFVQDFNMSRKSIDDGEWPLAGTLDPVPEIPNGEVNRQKRRNDWSAYLDQEDRHTPEEPQHDTDDDCEQLVVTELQKDMFKKRRVVENTPEGSDKFLGKSLFRNSQGQMVRTRGRNGSIIRRNHARRGVSRIQHGRLAMELGHIPYHIGRQSHDSHSSTPFSSTLFSSSPLSSFTPSSSIKNRFRFLPVSSSLAPIAHLSRFAPLQPSHAPPAHFMSTPTTQSMFAPTRQSMFAPTTQSMFAPTTQSMFAPTTQSMFAPLAQPMFAPTVQFMSSPLQCTLASPVQITPNDAVHPTSQDNLATSNHDILDEEVHRDANGRVIIRLVGKSWAPNRYAIDAIEHAIRSQFRGPHHHYEAMIEEVQLKCWNEFKSRVTWAPHDEWQIRRIYDLKVRKRLCDMLTKARVREGRPTWIGEQAWNDLLEYWDTKKFKQISSRNKTNRSSSRGGALHSSGRKSHLHIALSLEHKYGRPVQPDELFITTHTKKDGTWVDSCARETYETYHDKLRVMQSQSSEGSTSNLQQIDLTRKVQCWKDVAGGKSRGRCYGTADLGANIHLGVSSLTQPSVLVAPIDEAQQSVDIQALREQITQDYIRATAVKERATAAKERAIAAEEKAIAAEEKAIASDHRCTMLEERLKLMQEQLTMVMNRQIGDSSAGTCN